MNDERLNHDEFTAQVASGGSSRRMHDNSVPQSGYMVSKPGMEWVSSRAPSTTRTIAHHEALKIFGHALGSSPESHQGGWHDKPEEGGSGETFLDHSLRFPDLPSAMKAGRQWHQLGIYNAGTGKTTRISRSRWEGPTPEKNILGEHFENFQPRYREALGRHLRNSVGGRP